MGNGKEGWLVVYRNLARFCWLDGGVIHHYYNIALFSRRASAQPLLPFTKIHALIPVLIYANLMMFQVLFGFPVETRTIAVFAMGIPLLAALFTFANLGTGCRGPSPIISARFRLARCRARSQPTARRCAARSSNGLEICWRQPILAR